MSASEYFDVGPGTFRADRAFCEKLLESKQADTLAEMIAYFGWAHASFPHFQRDFASLVSEHFPSDLTESADFWTDVLLRSILKDLSMIPYLVIRGVIGEAGSVLRRGLEHLGVLTHFWADPQKVSLLGHRDSNEYRSAFESEREKAKQQDLKSRGTKKRFAQLTLAQPASMLYEQLSEFYVHGGSHNSLIHSSVDRTELSCWFLNRREPDDINIGSLVRGIEILCFEVANLYRKVAEEHSHARGKAINAAALFLDLHSFPNRTEEMQRQISKMRNTWAQQSDASTTPSKTISEWMRDQGLSKEQMTPKKVAQWFNHAGFETTEDGIPLIPGSPGQPQDCSRCHCLTECGIAGTSGGEPIVLCEACYLLMFRDTERFNKEGWGEAKESS